MKRKLLVLLAILAVTCWTTGVWADVTLQTGNLIQTFTTGANSTATFTLDPGNKLTITINYSGTTTTGGNLLTALFWTSPTLLSTTGVIGSAEGPLVSTSTEIPGSHPASFTLGTASTTTVSGFWGYGTGVIAGGNQGVGAAGLNYGAFGSGFLPLNGSGNVNNIDGPAYTILGASTTTIGSGLNGDLPYMLGAVTVVLNLPSSATTYTITGTPQAWLGTGHVAVPIPPTALLLGSGLLGLGLVGWRRRK